MGMELALVTFTGQGNGSRIKYSTGGKEVAGTILGYKQGRMANDAVWFLVR